MYIHFCAYMCTFFLVVAFRDARFLSGLYGRFSYIVVASGRQWSPVGSPVKAGGTMLMHWKPLGTVGRQWSPGRQVARSPVVASGRQVASWSPVGRQWSPVVARSPARAQDTLCDRPLTLFVFLSLHIPTATVDNVADCVVATSQCCGNFKRLRINVN